MIFSGFGYICETCSDALSCIFCKASTYPASSLTRGTGSEPFSIVSWKLDIKSLESAVFERMWPSISSIFERLGKLIELVSHRQHVSRILICGSPAPETMEMALKILPDTATITLGFDGEQELHLPNEAKARTTVRALPDSPEEWIPATDGPYDLVLVDYSGHQPSSPLEALIALVQSGGWLLGFSQQLSTVPSGSLQLGEHFAFFRTETYTNGTAFGKRRCNYSLIAREPKPERSCVDLFVEQARPREINQGLLT